MHIGPPFTLYVGYMKFKKLQQLSESASLFSQCIKINGNHWLLGKAGRVFKNNEIQLYD